MNQLNQLTAQPLLKAYQSSLVEVNFNPSLKAHFLVGNHNPLTTEEFKKQITDDFRDKSLFATEVKDTDMVQHLTKSQGFISVNLF